jgi:hypothetical protein
MEEVCPGHRNKAGESDFALIIKHSTFLLHLYKAGEDINTSHALSRLCAHCREERCYGAISNGLKWLFLTPDGKQLAIGSLDDPLIIDFLQMLDRRNFNSFGSFAFLIENDHKQRPMKAIFNKVMEETSMRRQLKEFDERINNAFREYPEPDKEWITQKDVTDFWQDVLCLMIKGGVPESRLLVRFADGQVFTNRYSKTVFVEAIQKIGVAQVFQFANIKVGNQKKKDGKMSDIMLVSKTQPERDHVSILGDDGTSYYLMTGSSTAEKVKQLEEIRVKLQIANLRIKQFGV